MPSVKEKRLETIGSVYKPDVIKHIAADLEKAKQKLISAQKSMNEAQIKKLEQIVADLTGTLERNS